MCFYHGDCDWTADIHEEEKRISTGSKADKCSDCFKPIPVGEEYVHHYWQEHGDCDAFQCEHGPDDECDFGETSEANQCQRCLRLIEAIAVVETAEGCVGESIKPMIGALNEQIECGEGWEYYEEKYKALRPDDTTVPWPS